METKYTKIPFTWPQGFKADGVHAGLRKVKLDMGWLYSAQPAAAAGVYTTNQFQAAPTKLTKKTINLKHQLQAIVLNSANANSCTGAQGEQDAAQMQQLAAAKLGVSADLVGVASTGIIGEQLPMDVIAAGIDQLQLTDNTKVTEAVLTTDTHAKTVAVTCQIDGKTVTLSGFCKGSGMIHPNMATMLGFVTTDAAIDGMLLQQLLSQATDTTFNQITVDGDTSTNDMVTVLANGAAGNTPLTATSADYETFVAAFTYVLGELAKKIAADGEGATKLVAVTVAGAWSDFEGQQVAKAIVGSNLVKAAIYGEDPNWGRIMVAIGQTDAHLDLTAVDVTLNELPLIQASQAATTEVSKLEAALAAKVINIAVELHNGNGQGQAWGCDLTYDYVKINATYHS
ncbi:bifunctional glutamate N-acetyltransferase/amino-acid acetyltransferase ArgJ [Loigolactobacillus coryniformis]|uniref:bifunctional glutamate N-acetyltransferase/amino-acid acetyltransferase ArgJ n=1 Tax=Loigolactobacillus coryniformis TaxID=1610 RepID=UPI0023425976|nr:bifunctional glutamate N-acetyltransferase/amino-acid acetyltransferase ArgJ [Loigolactobacillus coryniformis]MDC4186244.1 bifunctional glutamate N-acetyltransferase/amino-acid acetyltransferase ArgJ [Loigolactobacillus coryniformis]